ncbi:MAG TPA: topoisomerase DNA-binding C4 zinc finger domain-containing protein, partial [Candidatus Onthenecus intestinigallinarum]|nr:topoisomerase DNA-binding C4 zinc finger domain-containing protein [Candidatus Onthenecus intestinigallinarum]
MKLQKSKKGKFFIACTGYPSCDKTELVDVDIVEEYFYRHGGTGQHCTKCNYSLEAKLGPYGIYIQCCGMSHHKYKLDEI